MYASPCVQHRKMLYTQYLVMPVKKILFASSEMRTCLQNHPVAFIGDSRTRALYYELVQTVSLNSVTEEKKPVSLWKERKKKKLTL